MQFFLSMYVSEMGLGKIPLIHFTLTYQQNFFQTNGGNLNRIHLSSAVALREFCVLSGSPSFTEYYDQSQEYIKSLAGMDELLAG